MVWHVGSPRLTPQWPTPTFPPPRQHRLPWLLGVDWLPATAARGCPLALWTLPSCLTFSVARLASWDL